MNPSEVNVLIVDDGEENRIVIEEIVKSLGYGTVLAENGAKGLEKIRSLRPDVVLLDIEMPELDGYGVLAEIAKSPELKDIPVVMITSVDETASVVKCLELGAHDYLNKPVEPEILKARIHNCLAKAKSLRTEKELLERTLAGSIRILVDVLSIHSPAAFSKSTQVRRVAKALATDVPADDRWTIEVSAMLAFLGTTFLPSALAETGLSGRMLSEAERVQWDTHPAVAANLIAKIPRMEKVAETVRYGHRPFIARTAPPDGIADVKIPLAARILKIAVDCVLLSQKNDELDAVVEKMTARREQYDPHLFVKFKEWAEREAQNRAEIEVPLERLEPGMVLSRDYLIRGNTLIAAKGLELGATMIERIRTLAKASGSMAPLRILDSKAS